MSRPRSGLGIPGIVLMSLAALSLIGAALLAFSPGFRLAPPVAFGETMTLDLPAGDHAIYVTPNEEWGDIECTGTVAGDQLALRADMMQQDLVLPQRWNAQGSFGAPTAGTATISCDGPVADAQFTVGPAFSFLDLIGPVMLGILGLVLLIVGIVLWAVRPKHPPVRPRFRIA
jgi:hypothetical protein